MKKAVLGLLLVVLGAMCFGQDISTCHSMNSSCEAYRGKEAIFSCIGNFSTFEEVEKVVLMATKNSRTPIIVDKKAYKNEGTATYATINKYYTPAKGDLYMMCTFTQPKAARIIFIWMDEDNHFRWWVFGTL